MTPETKEEFLKTASTDELTIHYLKKSENHLKNIKNVFYFILIISVITSISLYIILINYVK